MKRGRPKGRSRDQRSFGPLGDLIRKHRLDRELGLADVAKACGCSVQFISNIEHGRAPLPWDKVPLLAAFLKIPAEELQAANLAIRSDFKSFVKLSRAPVKGAKGSANRKPMPSSVSNGAASAVAFTAKDDQLLELLQRYQQATATDRKKFVKAAMKMLN